VATQAFGAQQAGLAVLFVMFGAGLAVLSRMR
jgi:MFS-type transporter involved in bile tolerance (Atg22 family)